LQEHLITVVAFHAIQILTYAVGQLKLDVMPVDEPVEYVAG
jgi:hypothetical protein